MNKEYLNILLVDDAEENIELFKNIFNESKVGVKLLAFQDSNEFFEHLDNDETLAPEIIFINYDIFKNDLLYEIKKRENLYKVITVIYSEKISDDEIDDFFVNNGNVSIKRTENESAFKKKVSEVITVNWQYYTSGLNMDNFILKI
ncbi:response regulator [Chryseobacterium sp. MYb264]|uniref:response regulator n=1 Tax=Chryseobacterium sp. MYb264 TaxID=2745153 RepID=UPI002E1383C3|nr:response regulator [Chryseobacterium sp. MYb264]